MRMATCCFTGHRVQSLPWGGREEDPRCAALKARMRAAMVELVHTFGVRRFISGMALGVDTYAAELVLDLRAAGEPVSLECAIPFPGQADRWSARDRARYAALRAAAGRETLLQDHYSAGCFQRRNRYMVDESRFLLAVWDGRPGGGTASTVAYAHTRGDVELLILPPAE